MNAFRKLGYSVWDTSAVGRGFPDLIIAKNSEIFLVEVKTEKGKLNEKQEAFINKWNAEVFVIRTIDDVIAFDRDEFEAVRPDRTTIIIENYSESKT